MTHKLKSPMGLKEPMVLFLNQSVKVRISHLSTMQIIMFFPEPFATLPSCVYWLYVK